MVRPRLVRMLKDRTSAGPGARRRRQHGDRPGHHVGGERGAAGGHLDQLVDEPRHQGHVPDRAGEGDLVAADVDVDAGEPGLDGPQDLVPQAEQLDHGDLGGDADPVLDARGRGGGTRCGCGLGHVLGVRRALLRSVLGADDPCLSLRGGAHSIPRDEAAIRPSGPAARRASRARPVPRSTCAARAGRAARRAPPPPRAAELAVADPALGADDDEALARRPAAPSPRAARVASSCSTSATPPAATTARTRSTSPRPSSATSTSGTRARRDCLAAARTVPSQRARLFAARSPRHTTIDRSACHGTTRVDAHLGGRLDRHLVAVALGERLHEHQRDRRAPARRPAAARARARPRRVTAPTTPSRRTPAPSTTSTRSPGPRRCTTPACRPSVPSSRYVRTVGRRRRACRARRGRRARS